MNITKLSDLTLSQAKYLYANEPDMQNDLLKIFDLKDLKPFHYTDIKSFEDACEKLDIDTEIPISENIRNYRHLVADYKLTIIFEAINDGWTPDWNDATEYKYYPWFTMSSVLFRGSRSAYWYSASDAGSHLCTYSEETSNYIGKTFEDIYKDFLLS